MNSVSAFILSLTLTLSLSADPLPDVVGGKLTRHADFPSEHVASRHVDVWVPEGVDEGVRLPVLYMHDGQMLFDATTTWNKLAWDADDVAHDLIQAGKLSPFIIVGVWNGGADLRHPEYYPQKPYALLTEDERVLLEETMGEPTPVFTPISDRYLDFLVEELKPFIDQTYPTQPEREATFIAGSSMGGLISMYALCEYPQTFSAAACLSTHWPVIFTNEDNPIPRGFFRYLEAHLPDPQTVRLYFDLGDQKLDALYEPHQAKVDAIMQAKGFDETNWVTRRFPGTDHSETAWNARLDQVLLFLLSE